MSPAKLSRREERMAMIAVAVAELEDRGICWNAWAFELGLSFDVVANVRKGDRPCWTGESRKAADLILADARRAAVPTQLEADRDADIFRYRMALIACEEALDFARSWMRGDGRIDHALDLARRALGREESTQ